MKISFIVPGRNNLKYFKWSYDSIQKHKGNHEVEICFADDFSNDGTWEWCQETMKKDPNFKAIRNEGPTRLGHTILYDRLINTVSTQDICIIWHCDMYLCPGALDAIEKNIKPKTIVSLTRIEPPLHPPGPEKILLDCGIEPEQFDEYKLLEYLDSKSNLENEKNNLNTHGIFAPWSFYKSDFQEIGGHDPLFAPQSKEDSDIFNRFQLNGVEFIQTWWGKVYHMTCRGSRFNPTLTIPGKNSSEWEAQNQISSRNFIRKWGSFVKHDQFMKPIIPHKYDIGFIVKNCNLQVLELLEPWCSNIYIEDINISDEYIKKEQPKTKFNLSNKIFPNLYSGNYINNITVEFDAQNLNQNSFNIIQQLPEIIADSGQIGEFQLDIFKINIKDLTTYEHKLIKCSNDTSIKPSPIEL